MGATAGRPVARALCAALREALKTSGMRVNELARKLGYTHTEVSQWMNGVRVPSTEVVARLLTGMNVSRQECDRISELAREARKPNWLAVGLNGIPQQLESVIEHERAAIEIVAWAPSLIPGLLQTSDYTRAIKKTGGLQYEEIELRIMVNAGRRDVITRAENPVMLDAIIGEDALYDPIASKSVMMAQLRSIVSDAERPNVSVRTIPKRIGWHPGLSGPFIFFRFADASPAVYFEHHSSGAFITKEHDIAEYERAIEWLKKIAMTPEQSVNLTKKILETMETSE